MLLQNKNAVIYGGGGAIGGAVARAFAREGARVFLAGRTLARLKQGVNLHKGGQLDSPHRSRRLAGDRPESRIVGSRR